MSESSTPRDVKILHLILASMGVTSYQDHVPLQLMDFAHRYTVNVLSDAMAYNDYANASAAHQPAGVGASNAPLTVDDVRLAVSFRVNNQFKPAAPKEVLLELAQERNKRPLPPVPQGYGLRLPPEKYCLTGRDRSIEEDDDIILRGYGPLDLDVEENTTQTEAQNDAGEAQTDNNEVKDEAEPSNNAQDAEQGEEGAMETD